MGVLTNGLKTAGSWGLSGIHAIGKGVLQLGGGVKTAWSGNFNLASGSVISNVIWIAFFPVRAASTVVQLALEIVYEGCTIAYAMIFVLLKFPLGVEITTWVNGICTSICDALLPKSFAPAGKITRARSYINTDANFFKKAWKIAPKTAVKQTFGFRIMWILYCPVSFCLSALGRSLIVLASIAQFGAKAITELVNEPAA
ncbi:MAG: hypothetical protein LBC42_02305 [Puniceicoccales bacterium]|jgi:hypothetical protein|nr:hypothetical protein [Puniceicoccales bacterium]